jgi:hypothetical protein
LFVLLFVWLQIKHCEVASGALPLLLLVPNVGVSLRHRPAKRGSKTTTLSSLAALGRERGGWPPNKQPVDFARSKQLAVKGVHMSWTMPGEQRTKRKQKIGL